MEIVPEKLKEQLCIDTAKHNAWSSNQLPQLNL